MSLKGTFQCDGRQRRKEETMELCVSRSSHEVRKHVKVRCAAAPTAYTARRLNL